MKFVAGAMLLAGLALLLAAAMQSSAALGEAKCAAAALPADPDFEVHDPHPSWTNEQHPNAAYNPDKDEYLVVFDWDFNGSGDHDIMGITVTAAGVPAQNPIPIATGTTYDDAYVHCDGWIKPREAHQTCRQSSASLRLP